MFVENSSIFCIIDTAQNTVAVTVYNLVEGKGVIIGDAVAIPEPFFSQVHVSHKEKVRIKLMHLFFSEYLR